MGIVLFFLMFAVIVLTHEFGHFIVARASGIGVVEFCIGMGPKLVAFEKGGITYSVRLLPLGGACIFEGEDGKFTKEEGEMPEGQIPFPKAPVWNRIATVFAGPFFNFILAFLFSMIIIGSYGVDLPVVQKVAEGSAAQEAGLRDGDLIRKLDGKKIHLYREITLYSLLNSGDPITVEYERDGKTESVTVTPLYDKEAGRYYMGLLGVGSYQKFNILTTARYSFYEVRYWINTVIKSLELLIKGKLTKDDVAGPVGMAKMVNTVYTESKPDGIYYIWLNMLSFSILLSANLGVINLLPLPALDGGRLLFLFLEILRGKPIPPEKEGFVHMIGMAALMVLMAFIFYNDLRHLF